MWWLPLAYGVGIGLFGAGLLPETAHTVCCCSGHPASNHSQRQMFRKDSLMWLYTTATQGFIEPTCSDSERSSQEYILHGRNISTRTLHKQYCCSHKNMDLDLLLFVGGWHSEVSTLVGLADLGGPNDTGKDNWYRHQHIWTNSNHPALQTSTRTETNFVLREKRKWSLTCWLLSPDTPSYGVRPMHLHNAQHVNGHNAESQDGECVLPLPC